MCSPKTFLEWPAADSGSCISATHVACHPDHQVAEVPSFTGLSSFKGATFQVLTGGSLGQPACVYQGRESCASVCPASVFGHRPFTESHGLHGSCLGVKEGALWLPNGVLAD